MKVKKVPIHDRFLIERFKRWGESASKEWMVNHAGRRIVLDSLGRLKIEESVLSELISGDQSAQDESRLASFRDNPQWYSLDRSRRVYHHVTQMSRELRKSLLWEDGSPLFEIDVSGSHAALAYSIYGDDPEDHLLLKEKSRYKEVVEGEGFYEFLSSEVFDGEVTAEQRKRVKKTSFKSILFGSNFSQLDEFEGKVYEAFRRSFPILDERIRRMKYTDYTWLSYRLRFIEANLLFDEVALKFAEAHPDRCLVSIHDAFLTTEENLTFLENLILEAYESKIGVRPKVKVKRISEILPCEFEMAA